MTAEAWIESFAAASGTAAPSDSEIDRVLKLAAVAAHSSERIAAPLACWIAGREGIDLNEAIAMAERIGARRDGD